MGDEERRGLQYRSNRLEQQARLLNYDIDKNWQTTFWKRVLKEKDEQQGRL